MIEALKSYVVDYLEAATGTGEDLAGCTVHDMDIIPDTKHHPAITVDWAEDLEAIREKAKTGRVQLEMKLLVTLYVSSAKGLRAAHQALNNLVARVGEDRYLGLHGMLSRLSDPGRPAAITDALDTSWGIELVPGNNKGVVSAGNSAFASVAIAFQLRVWSVVTRALY